MFISGIRGIGQDDTAFTDTSAAVAPVDTSSSGVSSFFSGAGSFLNNAFTQITKGVAAIAPAALQAYQTKVQSQTAIAVAQARPSTAPPAADYYGLYSGAPGYVGNPGSRPPGTTVAAASFPGFPPPLLGGLPSWFLPVAIAGGAAFFLMRKKG